MFCEILGVKGVAVVKLKLGQTRRKSLRDETRAAARASDSQLKAADRTTDMKRTNQKGAVPAPSDAEGNALRALSHIGRRFQRLLNAAEDATEQLSLVETDFEQWRVELPPEAKHLVDHPLAQRLSSVLADLPDHAELWACELDDELFVPRRS